MYIIQPFGQLLPCWSSLSLTILNGTIPITGNKKRRGSKVSLRAYPSVQALALPPSKDKQRKACPRRVIYIHYDLTHSRLLYTPRRTPPMRVHLINIYKRKIRRREYKTHPRERFCCITAVDRSKVAKFGKNRQ